MKKKVDIEFMDIVGKIFLVVGILGALIIVASFDWDSYNRYKGLSLTHDLEASLAKADLQAMWIAAGAVLFFNVAVGTIILSLERIAQILLLDKNVEVSVGSEELESNEEKDNA